MLFAKCTGLATALTLAIADVSAAAAPEAPVVLENDHVRVSEIFAAPGEEVTVDGRSPRAIVSLTKSRVVTARADGKRSTVDYGPGQIQWHDAATPASATIVAGNLHLFIVELKRSAQNRGQPNAPLAKDHSTIVDPDQHHLTFENEHVRIIDGMAPAGARSAPHSHPPSVLVSLAKSRFRVTIGGKTRIFDFEPATVRWSNHFRHQWEILTGEARVVMVEIKSAHDDPQFRGSAVGR